MSTHNICFYREIRKILCGYPLLSVAIEKGFPLKGKNLFHEVFSFRADTFSEGALCVGKQTGSHKSCLPCKSGKNIYQVCLVP